MVQFSRSRLIDGHVFKVKVNFRSCFKDQGLLGSRVLRWKLIQGSVFKIRVDCWSCLSQQPARLS